MPDLQGVTHVTTHEEFDQFIHFPYQHYAHDAQWVPPLVSEQKKRLDNRKNPFFEGADMALFLGQVNGVTAGRIAAIDNRAYNEYHGTRIGFFGFFECTENQQLANLLIKVARDWLEQRGLTSMIGPLNPSMQDEIGILVDGFDKSPAIMMPYTKPYYDKLLQQAGLQKSTDLYAYRVTRNSVSADRAQRAEKLLKRRYPEINIRPVNMRRFKSEVQTIRTLYNRAWAHNWGFHEVSEREFSHMASQLKGIVDPDLVFIAEHGNQPVGFSLAIPDYNQVLRHLDGKLLPFGFLKLLYHRRHINRLRVALMGIDPEFQGRGIDALLHHRSIQKGLEKGYDSAELGWLLESNSNILRVVEKVGGEHDKTYRLYRT